MTKADMTALAERLEEFNKQLNAIWTTSALSASGKGAAIGLLVSLNMDSLTLAAAAIRARASQEDK